MRERGYPPSVREIGEAVGLTSPSTVHSHLATLQRHGLPAPRPHQAAGDRGPLRSRRPARPIERRPVRHVPLVGDVAAGTDVLAQENVEELLPLPEDFTGHGRPVHAAGPRRLDDRRRHPRRRLRRRRASRRRPTTATSSSPASPARRPRSRRSQRKGATITLLPANPRLEPMVFDADQVQIYGRVVTVHAPALTAARRSVASAPGRPAERIRRRLPAGVGRRRSAAARHRGSAPAGTGAGGGGSAAVPVRRDAGAVGG